MRQQQYDALRALMLLGSLSLTGCSSLPNVGPSTSEVVKEAAQTNEQRYISALIDDRIIQLLRARLADTSLTSFGDYRAPLEPRVGVGDTVTLTIWEAGSGGLFSPPASLERLVPGSRATTIPPQIIGRDGGIMVPYAGRIKAVGRSTSQIQTAIERALDGKAIQPQVLVSVTNPLSSSVTVIGEASGGARVPISPKGDRVLDVIATAGGNRAPISESFVQLTRGNRSARVAMSRVASNPRENIFVRPGDVLTVIRAPQRFMAYGATGRNENIPFDAEGMNLAQALTKAGGLLDYRSDPSGVFVFRLEPENIARAINSIVPPGDSGRRVKVVYQLNMQDPNSLFLAQQFPIFDGDLVYVSNAPFTDAQKIMQLFNLAIAPVATGASISTAVR